VIFGGGTPTGEFGFSQVFTAPEPMDLSTASGQMTLKTTAGAIIDEVQWTECAVTGQSMVWTGTAFIGHLDAPGANGAFFSPGYAPDGSFYIVSEKEPNDDIANGQLIPSETIMWVGHLHGDTDGADYFRIDVKTGDILTVRTYPGPYPDVRDTILSLRDETDAILDSNDDIRFGINLYSEIVDYTVDKDGPLYIVILPQMIDPEKPTVGYYLLYLNIQ
jgi:hypothetical protein